MVDEIFDRDYQAARADLNAGLAAAFSGIGRAIGDSLQGPSPHRVERALGRAQEAGPPRLTAPRGARTSTHRAPRL